ncbi:uncharacterized protein LOC144922785 [Branchiostoma floridae x Branchiostoma belcheri]
MQTCAAAAVGVLGLLWVVTAVFTCPEKCVCDIATSVYCDSGGLKQVPANIPLDTTSLTIRNNSIQNLSDADFSNLTSLERLYLDNNDIHVLPAGAFSHLTRLKRLNLSDNHIAYLPDGVFSHLTSLERLYLSVNNISSLPAGVFSHLTRLKELDLSNNRIADLPDGIFSNLTSLLWLSLYNNNISSLSAGVFSHLTRLKGLYPPHMEHSALIDIASDRVCSDRGNCTTGSAESTCVCNVGWTGPFCDEETFAMILRHCSLAEINVALGKKAMQSFTYDGNGAEKAVDGNNHECAMLVTGLAVQWSHWWKVDLAGFYRVSRIRVLLGTTFGFELTNITVRVGPNENFNQNDQCGQTASPKILPGPRVMYCSPPLYGRYVSVDVDTKLQPIVQLCEVEVYVTDICCDDSIELVNGQITPTSGGYCSGNDIQFSCDPGYEVIGNSSATCQKDGSWDRGIPTCQRICCDNTSRIMNGRITVNNDYCSGSSIEFTCDTGYQLVGSKTAFCTGKYWDREIPTCQRVCCDNITEIMHGLVNATEGHCYGNDISFSCYPGYELLGSSSTTCQEDGSWDPEIPTCQLPTEEKRTSTEAIIGGTSAGIAAVLIVVAAVFMVFLRRRRKRRKEEYISQSVAYSVPDDIAIHRRRLEEMVPLVPARSQFPKLETDPGRVTLGEKIGSGAFGIVYRATLTRNDQTEDVVVKTVKEHASEEDKLGFLEEIRAVVDLGVHKNLLGLVGCCTVVRDHLYLITEFMPYGDLKSFLKNCREEETSDKSRDDIYTFEVIQMYQVARQIARGMDHIARSRYVHGDLAARNVLVGKRLHVKISDFGLAEDIYSRGYRRQDRLQRVPWKWMAPERLEGGEAYTSQSDVWSFGIVLYEICTLGGDPYPGVAVSELKDRLQAGFRMDQPEDCPGAMYDLMQQCWRWQPIQRPLFSQLYLTLDKHLAFYGPEYLDTN